MLAARVYNKGSFPVTQVFVLGVGRDVLNKGLYSEIHMWKKTAVSEEPLVGFNWEKRQLESGLLCCVWKWCHSSGTVNRKCCVKCDT